MHAVRKVVEHIKKSPNHKVDFKKHVAAAEDERVHAAVEATREAIHAGEPTGQNSTKRKPPAHLFSDVSQPLASNIFMIFNALSNWSAI